MARPRREKTQCIVYLQPVKIKKKRTSGCLEVANVYHGRF